MIEVTENSAKIALCEACRKMEIQVPNDQSLDEASIHTTADGAIIFKWHDESWQCQGKLDH